MKHWRAPLHFIAIAALAMTFTQEEARGAAQNTRRYVIPPAKNYSGEVHTCLATTLILLSEPAHTLSKSKLYVPEVIFSPNDRTVKPGEVYTTKQVVSGATSSIEDQLEIVRFASGNFIRRGWSADFVADREKVARDFADRSAYIRVDSHVSSQTVHPVARLSNEGKSSSSRMHSRLFRLLTKEWCSRRGKSSYVGRPRNSWPPIRFARRTWANSAARRSVWAYAHAADIVHGRHFVSGCRPVARRAGRSFERVHARDAV